jgi:hypothetical protein
MKQSRRQRRGFFTVEAIGAIIVLVVLALVLSVAVGRQRKGSDRLAASRAAVNLAERSLTALQIGEDLPQQEGATVKVDPIVANAPKGLAWANVTVSINGRSASLSGLVKSNALAKVRGGKS